MHWILTETQGYYELEAVKALPSSLLYGYSVYTTFCWPIECDLLIDHLTRLSHDAEAMGIEFPWQAAPLMACLLRYHTPEQPVVRLTALPDIRNFRDLLSPDDEVPGRSELFVSFSRRPQPQESFLRLQTAEFQDPVACIKHGSMAAKLRLRREAVRQGYDDVLFINRNGYFSEASTSNVFFIKQGMICTPDPERDACLPGITRKMVLNEAMKQGIPVSGNPVSPEQLADLEGAFLTNAVLGLQPVGSIGGTSLAWPEAALAMFGRLSAKEL